MDTQLDVGDTVDAYVIDEVLATGETTTTYRATHGSLGRTVALKVFHGEVFAADPGAREAAHRDATRSARLEHPAIATVYTAGVVGDGMYVASTLVSGPTLEQTVRAGSVSPKRCAEIVTTIAGALDAAHAVGVVHRELRPQAITIDRWGHPMLRDFGVTRVSGRTGLATRFEFGETLRYAAPELILGKPATPAVDVYGLAATALFCLTGTHPFPDLPIGELVTHRTTAPPPRLDAPADLAAIFESAMSIDPAVRPTTPSAFAAALSDAVSALPSERADAASPFTLTEGGEPDPTAPESAPAERAMPLAVPPVPADATRVDRQRTFAPVHENAPAPRAWNRIIVAAVAIVACAVIGFTLGQATAHKAAPLKRTGPFGLVTGTAWTAGGAGVKAVDLASPTTLSGPGRAATVGTAPHARLPGDPLAGKITARPRLVRAGSRALVRYQASDAVVFALPTSGRTLVAACTPRQAARPCAALLAAARSGSARAISPIPQSKDAEQLAGALRALEVDRGTAAAELTGPRSGRAAAAGQLAGAYRTAAEALQQAKSPAAAVLREPLLDAAKAADDLSSSIDRSSAAGYASARARLTAAEGALRAAVERLGHAGYRTAT